MRHSETLNAPASLACLSWARNAVLFSGWLLLVAGLPGCSPFSARRGELSTYHVQLLPGSSHEKSVVKCRGKKCPPPTFMATTWTPIQPPHYVGATCVSCVTDGMQPETETETEPEPPELAPEESPVPPPTAPNGDLFPLPEAPGPVEPGVGEPGLEPPGMPEPGFDVPGLGVPGVGEPVPSEPGFGEPGLSEPGFGEAGTVRPGLEEPGGERPPGLEPPDVIDLPLPDDGASGQVPLRRLGAAPALRPTRNAKAGAALALPEIELVGGNPREGAEPWSARIVSAD